MSITEMVLGDGDTFICPQKEDRCVLEGGLFMYQAVTSAAEAERPQKAKQWLNMIDLH